MSTQDYRPLRDLLVVLEGTYKAIPPETEIPQIYAFRHARFPLYGFTKLGTYISLYTHVGYWKRSMEYLCTIHSTNRINILYVLRIVSDLYNVGGGRKGRRRRRGKMTEEMEGCRISGRNYFLLLNHECAYLVNGCVYDL